MANRACDAREPYFSASSMATRSLMGNGYCTDSSPGSVTPDSRPLLVSAQPLGSVEYSTVATSPCATGATSDRELAFPVSVRVADRLVGGGPQDRRMRPPFRQVVVRWAWPLARPDHQ